MNKLALYAATVALAIGLGSAPALAGADDYGIINKTGMDITHLYVSLHADDEWGEDILGRDVLESGDECEIEFDPSEDDECAYDLKIVDGKGKAWTVTNVDFCKYTKVTFKMQGGKVVYLTK
jgi:hypothetical protein